jgi:hypothetical protein
MERSTLNSFVVMDADIAADLEDRVVEIY